MAPTLDVGWVNQGLCGLTVGGEKTTWISVRSNDDDSKDRSSRRALGLEHHEEELLEEQKPHMRTCHCKY